MFVVAIGIILCFFTGLAPAIAKSSTSCQQLTSEFKDLIKEVPLDCRSDSDCSFLMYSTDPSCCGEVYVPVRKSWLSFPMASQAKTLAKRIGKACKGDYVCDCEPSVRDAMARCQDRSCEIVDKHALDTHALGYKRLYKNNPGLLAKHSNAIRQANDLVTKASASESERLALLNKAEELLRFESWGKIEARRSMAIGRVFLKQKLFNQARFAFQAAVDIDSSLALVANYNITCAYALEDGNTKMALIFANMTAMHIRKLQMPNQILDWKKKMLGDPDLKPLLTEPAFQQVIKQLDERVNYLNKALGPN